MANRVGEPLVSGGSNNRQRAEACPAVSVSETLQNGSGFLEEMLRAAENIISGCFRALRARSPAPSLHETARAVRSRLRFGRGQLAVSVLRSQPLQLLRPRP